MRRPALVAILILGCGSSSSTEPAQQSTAQPTADETPAPAPTADDAPTPEPDPAPPPVLGLVGEVVEGGVAIRVESRGARAANLSGLLVEKRGDDGWEAAAELSLRSDCQTEAPPCVELVPGAVLMPPKWLGTRGDAQCDCDRCARAGAGEYRLVALSCAPEGHLPHRVAGAAFTLSE